MKRMPIPGLVLAVALAVLLPLEQAHCMWMGLQKNSAPVAAAQTSVHACCARAAQTSGHARPQGAAPECNCPKLPSVTLPGHVKVAAANASAIPFVVPTFATPGAPVSLLSENAPAPDVGSPPLPLDAGAHGLRAPPVSA